MLYAIQEKADAAYKDQKLWTKMSIMSTAGSGKFSTDRTISDYAKVQTFVILLNCLSI